MRVLNSYDGSTASIDFANELFVLASRRQKPKKKRVQLEERKSTLKTAARASDLRDQTQQDLGAQGSFMQAYKSIISVTHYEELMDYHHSQTGKPDLVATCPHEMLNKFALPIVETQLLMEHLAVSPQTALYRLRALSLKNHLKVLASNGYDDWIDRQFRTQLWNETFDTQYCRAIVSNEDPKTKTEDLIDITDIMNDNIRTALGQIIADLSTPLKMRLKHQGIELAENTHLRDQYDLFKDFLSITLRATFYPKSPENIRRRQMMIVAISHWIEFGTSIIPDSLIPYARQFQFLLHSKHPDGVPQLHPKSIPPRLFPVVMEWMKPVTCQLQWSPKEEYLQACQTLPKLEDVPSEMRAPTENYTPCKYLKLVTDSYRKKHCEHPKGMTDAGWLYFVEVTRHQKNTPLTEKMAIGLDGLFKYFELIIDHAENEAKSTLVELCDQVGQSLFEIYSDLIDSEEKISDLNDKSQTLLASLKIVDSIITPEIEDPQTTICTLGHLLGVQIGLSNVSAAPKEEHEN